MTTAMKTRTTITAMIKAWKMMKTTKNRNKFAMTNTNTNKM